MKEINLICKLHGLSRLGSFFCYGQLWFDAKLSLLATVGHVGTVSLQKLFWIDKVAVLTILN